MNLCGDIVNVSERELLKLDIPDVLNSTPRRKGGTPGSHRNRGLPPTIESWKNPSGKKTPSSRTPTNGRSPRSASTAPSPSMMCMSPGFMMSKDQTRKPRSKKLQNGATPVSSKTTLRLISKLETGMSVKLLTENGGKEIILDLEDGTLEYIRFQSPLADSDGSDSNGEKVNLKLKVNEITRLEVGRIKNAALKEACSPKPVKCFCIGTKGGGGEVTYYTFEADSLVQRDTIVAAIKATLEQSRARRQSRKTSSKAPGTGAFDFDVADNADFAIEAAPKGQKLKLESRDDAEHRHDGGDREEMPSEAQLVATNKKGDDQVSVDVAGQEWTDIFCGVGGAMGSTKSNTNGSSTTKRSTFSSLDCQNEALAAVEDVELTHMAANQVPGAWCTDDMCGASLKDFTDTMKGIFEIKQNSRDSMAEDEKKRAMAEDYLANVLSAPANVVNLISVKEIWQGTAPQKRRRKVPQNRASMRNASAVRLEELRNQMTFAALEANNIMPHVQVIHSFDDLTRSRRFKNDSTERCNNETTDSTNAHSEKSPQNGNSSTEDDGLYYDSDPEDTREQKLRRGPRRAVAEMKNASQEPVVHAEALSNIASSRYGSNKRWRKLEDEVMAEIISTMKNEKLALMWHPAPSKENPSSAPVCVDVWVESGVYLVDGTFLLPKLTWSPKFEKALEAKTLNVTSKKPRTMDLLDVCRVRECMTIDREKHPFANTSFSFLVQTQNGTELFEARSKKERGRIVNGLRLVIARLASLLMLRDLRAVDEFFGGNTAVPGEAPVWAQGKNDKDDGTTQFPGSP